MNCKLQGTLDFPIYHMSKRISGYIGDPSDLAIHAWFAREVQNHLYIFQPSSSQKLKWIFLYSFIYTWLWVPDLCYTFKLKVITNHESSQEKEKKHIFVSIIKIVIELASGISSDEVIFYRIRMRTGQACMHAWGFILQYYTWLMRMHACMHGLGSYLELMGQWV